MPLHMIAAAHMFQVAIVKHASAKN